MLSRATMLAFALLGLGGTAWWWTAPDDAQEVAALPVPPFPPRITEGRDYETCLASLAEDPAGAAAMAEAWQAKGGGDGARHCQALALIASDILKRAPRCWRRWPFPALPPSLPERPCLVRPGRRG